MTTQNEASPLPSAPVTNKEGTALRKGAVGVFGIVFFVLSAQAPLTAIAGALPLTVFLGNGAGAPGAYLVVGLIFVLFAVGFIAMSRRIASQGAFYAYVSAGFGRPVGAGSAWLAMLAYATIQASMYGLYGVSLAALIGDLGVQIPWWLPVLVTIALIQLLGSLNIELGARVLAVLVGLEVAILLLFAVVTAILHGGPRGSIDFVSSFSPGAVMAGAPGVAIVFAVASMFGFESTAIYSGEAKDAQRTVARATYLSVAVIAVFFSFVSWMFVSYYGAANVSGAAQKAVTSGDSTSFVFGALNGILGGWAGFVANLLLISSLFAGILAFHNGINRYVHALANEGSLPARFGKTNRHLAPASAAWVQTVMSIVLVAPFAIFNLDPILTLFSWFSGLSVAALVALYVLCSIAVVTYFVRQGGGRMWQTRIAPVLAALLLLGALALLVYNFPTLIGGDVTTAAALLVVVPVIFVVGLVLEVNRRRTRGRELFPTPPTQS